MANRVELSRKPEPAPIIKLLRPFERFVQMESFSGILLFICTVIALIWANSPWANLYHHLWEVSFTLGFGTDFVMEKPLHHWINDGLMAIFFFVVGLEIKREILVGELSVPRQAIVPIAAAVGGMLLPASIYAFVNAGSDTMGGWGIPMATDIAFSLAILSVLGNRVPIALKVFLTALAIVDDIGAVLVIAIFYTSTISVQGLALGGGIFLVLIVCNRLRIRSPLAYTILGIVLWIGVLKSGIHATIAGILIAMTIPSRTHMDADEFVDNGQFLLKEFERADNPGENILANTRQHSIIETLEIACEQAATPLQRMEHQWHGWVSYAIMPLFALANAGVSLNGNLAAAFTQPVALGVILGLVIGKQAGIMGAVWLIYRMGWSALPAQTTWRHIYGVGWLAGVGFTMSLFIAGLAFTDDAVLAAAKMGVLAASLMAGLGGWLILRGCNPTGSPR